MVVIYRTTSPDYVREAERAAGRMTLANLNYNFRPSFSTSVSTPDSVQNPENPAYAVLIRAEIHA